MGTKARDFYIRNRMFDPQIAGHLHSIRYRIHRPVHNHNLLRKTARNNNRLRTHNRIRTGIHNRHRNRNRMPAWGNREGRTNRTQNRSMSQATTQGLQQWLAENFASVESSALAGASSAMGEDAHGP
jgi:hypothetical protein